MRSAFLLHSVTPSAKLAVSVALSLGLLLSTTMAAGSGDPHSERRHPELTTREPFVIDNAVEKPEHEYGGTLRTGVPALPATFNPFLRRRSATDDAFFDQVLPQLVTLDRRTLDLAPYAAASIHTVVTGRVLEFRIREGIRWSDFARSSKELSADDVVFSARLHADPAVGSLRRNLFFFGGGPVLWEKVGQRTVRMTLPRPSPIARTFSQFEVVPEHIFRPVYESGGAAAVRAMWSVATPPSEIVGAGPFTLRSMSSDAMVLDRRSETWFVDVRGRPVPFLGAMSFARVAQLTDAFVAGRSDVLSLQGPATRALVDRIRAELLDAEFVDRGAPLLFNFITLNWNSSDPNKNRLFRNVQFRRALSHLVDRDRIVSDVLGGLGSPLFGLVAPSHPFFNPAIPRFPFDPAEARRLIEGLGFLVDFATGIYRDARGDFGGMDLRFTLLTNAGNVERAAVQQRVVADLRANGIALAAATEPFVSVTNRLLFSRDFDVILIGVVPSFFTPVPDIFSTTTARMLPLYSTGNPFEAFEFALDRLVQVELTELDPVVRRQAIFDAQSLIAENQALTFTVTASVVDFVQKRVRNATPAGPWSTMIGVATAPYSWVISLRLAVAVDIKPQSCPNPLNVRARGVLPVAILGTATFDATTADPASVKLEGVPALRSALEDVATPFVPFTGKRNAADCTADGPDGFTDLTLNFDSLAVVAALGTVTDGEVRILHLTGNLLPAFGSTPIAGEDVVVIVKKP